MCRTPLGEHIALSRLESPAQVRRDHGAHIVSPPEDTKANARDEIVDQVAKRPRNYDHERRQYFPYSSKSPENMNPGT